ncbi:glycosyltransferase family 39 protein [Actinoplanes sp. NPDC023714]|uniref:glycosyltransferase family 39 protein n=1 Tax=Actinoplanes sp. NPDC023714 TaxID=3154322 RepID=UPI0033F6B538
MSLVADLAPPAVAPEPQPSSPSARSRWQRLYWLLPALVTAAVVAVQIGRPQLWRDEFATVTAVGRSLGEMRRLAQNIDAVLTPYYLFMHFWSAVFGNSTVALRMPSLLAVAGTAALLAVLGERLFSVRAGVFAGLFWAILPAVSRYGQEARPYALAALAATAATLMLVEAVRKGRWWRWTGYALCVLALGALHLVAVVLVAGHGIAVLSVAIRRRNVKLLVPAGIAVAAAGAALLPLALRGNSQWSVQLGVTPRPPSWETLIRISGDVTGAASTGGILLGMLLIGAGASRRGRLMAAVLAAPLVAFTTVTFFTPLWHPRYLFFLVPLACLLAGAGLALVSARSALVVVLLAGVVALSDHQAVRASHEGRGAPLIDYRAAVAVLEQHAQPGDAIVYKRNGWHFTDIATEYYLGTDAPRDALLKVSRTAAGSFWTTERTNIKLSLAADPRVWTMVPDDAPNKKSELPAKTLGAIQADFTKIGEWRVGSITLRLYDRK